jgi:hypothetical protein
VGLRRNKQKIVENKRIFVGFAVDTHTAKKFVSTCKLSGME